MNPTPLFVKDAPGRFERVNAARLALMGLSLEQAISATSADLFGGEAPMHTAPDERRLQSAAAVRSENRLKVPPLWVDVNAFRTQQVQAEVPGAGVMLGVRGHDPGIPPVELETVFGAFVQSSRTCCCACPPRYRWRRVERAARSRLMASPALNRAATGRARAQSTL